MKVRDIIYLIWSAVIILSVSVYGCLFGGILISLTIVSFVQNMFFTWVSRSRQGGDPDYHRFAAWGSNGVWLLTQGFIAANVYSPITIMIKEGVDTDSIMKIFLTFIVYALATTEGSVTMMKMNLGKYKLPKFMSFIEETGKRKVGAR